MDVVLPGLDNFCRTTSVCGPSNLGWVAGSIASALIFLVGAVSVIMVIVGGLRYVISMGNSKQVEQAKNTILYAVIGVVVAVSSYAVVSFVTGRFH